MSEKIMTLHPEGKQGVNINKGKYEAVKAAILTSLEGDRDILFRDLPAAVEARLPASFEGSVGWYTTTVKLDLEARGSIYRVPKKSPQILRLTDTQ